MFFYLFFILSTFFIALDSKNSEHIKTVTDFNNIGLFQWGNEILHSNNKKREIVDWLKATSIDKDLREACVRDISAWRVLFFFHDTKDQLDKVEMKKAYADFRDSLTDEQLQRLMSKLNMVFVKGIGIVFAAYAGLVALAVYAEQQAGMKAKSVYTH